MKVLSPLIMLSAGLTSLPLQAAPVRSEIDLVGCYASTTDLGGERVLLELRKDMTYVVFTNVSLGIWAKATGRWYFEDRALLLGEPNEAKGWHYYMQPIHISSNKGSITLTTAGAEKLVSGPSGCGL